MIGMQLKEMQIFLGPTLKNPIQTHSHENSDRDRKKTMQFSKFNRKTQNSWSSLTDVWNIPYSFVAFEFQIYYTHIFSECLNFLNEMYCMYWLIFVFNFNHRIYNELLFENGITSNVYDVKCAEVYIFNRRVKLWMIEICIFYHFISVLCVCVCVSLILGIIFAWASTASLNTQPWRFCI